MVSTHSSWPSLPSTTKVDRLVSYEVLQLALQLGSTPWCASYEWRMCSSQLSIQQHSRIWRRQMLSELQSLTSLTPSFSRQCTFFWGQFFQQSGYFVTVTRVSPAWINCIISRIVPQIHWTGQRVYWMTRNCSVLRRMQHWSHREWRFTVTLKLRRLKTSESTDCNRVLCMNSYNTNLH